MKVVVEAHIRWNAPLDEEVMERIAEAFHQRESDGRFYDVSVGGSVEGRWIDVSFGLTHVEKQSLKELVPTVQEIIEEALRSNMLPSGIPPAHVIDGMAFRPNLSDHSS